MQCVYTSSYQDTNVASPFHRVFVACVGGHTYALAVTGVFARVCLREVADPPSPYIHPHIQQQPHPCPPPLPPPHTHTRDVFSLHSHSDTQRTHDAHFPQKRTQHTQTQTHPHTHTHNTHITTITHPNTPPSQNIPILILSNWRHCVASKSLFSKVS